MAPKKIYYAFGHEPSPSYVTDGLVGYWDAGNPASYPGSGTDWLDLTTNNNGVLTNGPVFSLTSGAHFEFDGDDDYVELGTIDATNPLCLAGSLKFTFEVWARPDLSGDSFQRFFDKSTGGGASNGFAFFESTGAPGVSVDGVTVTGPTTFFNLGSVWYQILAKKTESNELQFFRNGISFGTGYSFAGVPPNITTNMRIATWNHSVGREFNGKIGAIRIYNKALNGIEITQNFNHLKSRYGL